jgi:hypothetical protein
MKLDELPWGVSAAGYGSSPTRAVVAKEDGTFIDVLKDSILDIYSIYHDDPRLGASNNPVEHRGDLDPLTAQCYLYYLLAKVT